MLTVSDEQRLYLNLDGTPLPMTDPESGRSYMLMPVSFTRKPDGTTQAHVPGIRAVGEGDQPAEALATLAILLKDVMERL